MASPAPLTACRSASAPPPAVAPPAPGTLAAAARWDACAWHVHMVGCPTCCMICPGQRKSTVVTPGHCSPVCAACKRLDLAAAGLCLPAAEHRHDGVALRTSQEACGNLHCLSPLRCRPPLRHGCCWSTPIAAAWRRRYRAAASSASPTRASSTWCALHVACPDCQDTTVEAALLQAPAYEVVYEPCMTSGHFIYISWRPTAECGLDCRAAERVPDAAGHCLGHAVPPQPGPDPW